MALPRCLRRPHPSWPSTAVYERVSSEKQDLARQAIQRERAKADYPDREPIIVQDDGISAYKRSIFDRDGGARLSAGRFSSELPA
jgi:predicted site-specific integrase-resolvase